MPLFCMRYFKPAEYRGYPLYWRPVIIPLRYLVRFAYQKPFNHGDCLLMKYLSIYLRYTAAGIGIIVLFACCSRQQKAADTNSFPNDSARIVTLLLQGDSLYSGRNSMNAIGESLLYFDSAHRLAQRLNDPLLMANTLFFIGNVYNAWNGEPQKTIDYYSRSAALYATIPGTENREFYLRYMIAHGYDGEKANDSTRCVQTILQAMKDLESIPDSIKDSMDYLPDFAWVATNAGAYTVAEDILKKVRHRPENDPESNNYLDHYYITRCRIDVFGYGRVSNYTDSLVTALAKCNNRFDSAYYAANLSSLYARSGNYKKAFYFSKLNNDIQNQLAQSDILTSLRTQLLNSELEGEKEKEQRNREEIKIKTLYLYAAGLVFIIFSLLVILHSIYQKRKLAQLQVLQQEAFTKQQLQKEEDERKRIAMELHDGINHELLLLKNQLLLSKPIEPTQVEHIINTVREASRALYPAMFENVGLRASVEALCNNMTDAGFFTTCDITYTQLLDRDEELQVYRIIQEALHNIAKHAGAQACKVTIRSGEQRLFTEIKDNGRGFDPGNTGTTSFGVESMRQRAKAINAKLTIASSGSGTVITIIKEIQ